ncbi:heavy metal sensor signal transduction histidine kinase [Orbus hercynius]|uniref:Sensor protein n=1 Tax=Orbus hercynius TaxID=593135 RepID=A0A495RED1_9GAMM|nr:heavy metal sensor histidine kinase [Orbus hercynius]RKS85288.1 heavy metal sensor signal transduction histidine kinase [Orbus hercynius]
MITHFFRSLAFRLALMFSLSSMLVLLLLGFVVVYAVNQHFIAQDRMVLNAQSGHLVHALGDVANMDELHQQMQSLSHNMTGEHGSVVLLLNNHQPLYDSQSDFALEKALMNISQVSKKTLITLYEGDYHYRVLIQPVDMPIAPNGVLIIALNIEHHESFLTSFHYSMWLIIAIAALIMGIGACLAANHGLRPLHTLVAQSENITVDNLDTRLPMVNTYSEINQLTLTFNAMLDRLNQAFNRLSGFSSDLAHELRTPLTTIKMQYQVILSRARSVEEYQQALVESAEELDHLIRMVTDLLFIAKSENGLMSPQMQTFAIADEISSLFDFYGYIAQEKAVTLHQEGEAQITADRTLLRRALSNLIANAIHYGYANSAVNIRVAQQGEQVHIVVQNQGETIDPKHLPHIFERFYRVDTARTHFSDGVGLGLAITAAIIAAHQGTITASSQHHVTCFTIILNQS